MSNENQIEFSGMPLDGVLVKTVINSFTSRPYRGNDRWPQCSIGIAEDSICATDQNSAVLIGKRADHHCATERKEALLEAERSIIYGHPVRLDEIARRTDDQTGEVELMPYVQQIIQKHLDVMSPLASVDPVALIAIGKLAVAAGALSVELFQPRGDANVLGFKFSFFPASEHTNLFTNWEGTIDAEGVFKATASSRLRALQEQTSPETAVAAEVEVETPKGRGRAKKKPEAPKEPEHQETEPVVTVNAKPVDRMARELRGIYMTPAMADVLDPEEKTVAVGGEYAKAIMENMRAYNIPARMAGIEAGPTVTMYEIDVPPGQPVKKLAALADDLQMQLAVKSVRIQAPIPGKKAVGIEIPNKKTRMVRMMDVCASHEFVDAESRLTIGLGLDVSGKPIYADIAGMPHLLISGATNSGKSIMIASVLNSLLLRNGPHELRMVLIDPKQVELSLYEGLPHLMTNVITEMSEVPGVLRAVIREMERRYGLCKEKAVRNIAGFNEKASENEKMPYILVVIDELADLMLTAQAEVEPAIVKLGQKARAVGIHMVLATQSPRAEIITGLIKSNVPTRIAFSVAQGIDSQVILDCRGAEKLVGKGDMLFMPVDAAGRPMRVQGAYVSEHEVETICRYWRAQSNPFYDLKVAEDQEKQDQDPEPSTNGDARYADAVAWARERGKVSTAMLQRKFSFGFMAACQIIERMESEKICGPKNGPAPRDVFPESEVLA